LRYSRSNGGRDFLLRIFPGIGSPHEMNRANRQVHELGKLQEAQKGSNDEKAK
jgi:hypothetical protein